VWRPAASVCVMAASLVGLQASALIDVLPVPLRLVLQVGAGAGVYAASLLAFWALAGRPAGAEQFAIDTLRARFGKKTALPEQGRLQRVDA